MVQSKFAAAELPGQGHSTSLSTKACDIRESHQQEFARSAVEVGEPFITPYVNHVSSHPNARKTQPHVVMPDIIHMC